MTIVYDGDGNRVSKTAGGVTTNYLVDTNNLTGYAQVVEEIQGGIVVKAYTYGHDLISQRMVGGNGSFYGYDGHGSVRNLSDANGQITDTYSYDALGNLIESTRSTPNNYLYAGEQFDPDLGFYYNRARYLNVATGRFVSMDSFEGNSEDPSSLHKYLYVGNDSINHVDPTGNFEFTIAGQTINITIQGVLSSIAINALIGGVIGAVDASLSGEDVVDGTLRGAAIGGLLGPFGKLPYIGKALLWIGVALAATSAYNAYQEENFPLALFRGLLFVAGAKAALTSNAINTGNVSVYRSVNPATNEVQYIGITENFEARTAAHLAQKGIQIEKIGKLENLSREDARAVEQVLIEYYGLGKN